MTSATCTNCGKIFEYISKHGKGYARKFCSVECKHAYGRIKKICLHCGKEFIVQKANSRRKFCSQTCSNRFNQQPDPTKKSIFVCKWCGKEFEGWVYRNPSICSDQCRSEYGAHQPKPNQRRPDNFITQKCIVCGTEFTVHKCQNTGRNGRNATYCSVRCKYTSRMSGAEIRCKEIFDNLGISYISQCEIKDKFIVDFRIDNIIIQVDGEFWHGHPRFDPLRKHQIQQRKRDAAHDKYLTACGFKVVRIWENDINQENIHRVLKENNIL